MSPTRSLLLFALGIAVVPLAGPLSTASADITGSICQGPTKGPVTPIVEHNACVGYRIEKKNGTSESVRFDVPGSGKLVASDDGRTVVMFQSYLYGGIDDAGNIIEHVASREKKNPIAIYVYRDGKQVATHRIHGLLVRKKLIRRTISHVLWLRSVPKTLGDDEFTITTSSYRSITFNTATGTITKQEDAPEWNRCDLIATGKLDLRNNQLTKAFLLKTLKRAKGPIQFQLEEGLGLTHNAYATVCLERHAKSLWLTEQLWPAS